MNNAGLILEATKIVDENLTSSLTVKGLAEKIGYSLFHFIRLFHGVVGCSPGEYLASRRLAKSAEDLLYQKRKIIDIALKYQFSTPESYSRAFKGYAGITPSKFRSTGELSDISYLPWSSPYYTDIAIISSKELLKEPEIIEMNSILLAGRLIEVKKDISVIGKLWSDFIKLTPPPSAVTPLEYAQCGFWDPEEENERLYIMTSFIVEKMDSHNTFIYKEIPKSKYLKFPHYGPSFKISETYNWIFSEWLPKKKYKLPQPYSLEIYPTRESEDLKKGITAWILLPTN